MIGIGISTYNDFASTERLIRSIKKFTKGEYGKDYSILVYDDGTTNNDIYSNLVNICNNHNVYLLKNSNNRGIPYTWNRIVEFFNTDIVIIFNNDIMVINENWLQHMEYILKNNEKIGTAGFPLINPPHFAIQDDNVEWNKSLEPMWGQSPGRVGASVGCCFGLKKNVWQQVKNPDGSTGFWEDLVSFHEEIHFGFRLYEIGYYNIMLNWPPMVHLGGQTFARNPELIERSVDWSKWDKQEYIDTIMRSKIYPEDWKRSNKIVFNSHGTEVVDRMAFSRYMFAKYWNVLNSYDMPQVEVHNRIVNPMPGIKVKWLNKEMKERENDI